MAERPSRPYLVGYPDRLSVRPGDDVEVMAATDRPGRAAASLVRLGAGEVTGAVRETVIADLGDVDVERQWTQNGSFMVVPGASHPWPAGPFVAAVLAMPTRFGRRQVLLAQSSTAGAWSLHLDEVGRPVAAVGSVGHPVAAVDGVGRPVAAVDGDGGSVAVGDDPLVEGAWYVVAAGFDPEFGVSVASRPLAQTAAWRTALDSTVVGSAARTEGPLPFGGLLAAPLVVAAAPLGAADAAGAAPADPGGTAPAEAYGWCYDGKLELPQLLTGSLDADLVDRLAAGELVRDRLLVGWDFAVRLAAAGRPGASAGSPGTSPAGSPGAASAGGPDRLAPGLGTAGCDGVLWNTPTDAVTGHSWDGAEQDFRQVPDQYGAIHFHHDDLDDCRWSPTVRLSLAADLPSGAYAVRLADDRGVVDRVPFFVRAATPAAPILFLVPTASYLAYANDHPVSDGSFSEATAAQVPVMYEDDLLLHEHREWGLSCYDSHQDGSGVGVSTARRPMLNMRPTHRYHVGSWQLPSDLAILNWLDDEGIAYDVATDEDLHREGADLLAPYRVLVTGTHAEYYSTPMLDAVETYLDGGGRLAYLGANGFYWRVGFDPDRPWLMELRRGQAGSRAWESAPGETHMSSTGERGGLWRHLGRPPQRLTGVGYAAQGFDRSGWYRRLTDSHDPRAAFIFDGVTDDVFGTTGTVGGGAVGQEIDRYDRTLGTPADALLLATSQGLTEGYRRCVEELLFTLPGTSALVDPQVRGDMVYHVKPGGGAVFAVGSIAWGGALGVDPAVTRITRNVLHRFSDPAPLPW